MYKLHMRNGKLRFMRRQLNDRVNDSGVGVLSPTTFTLICVLANYSLWKWIATLWTDQLLNCMRYCLDCVHKLLQKAAGYF